MQRAPERPRSPGSVTAEPLFPPRQAFVVHFQTGSDGTDARCEGRVEHVLSGRCARFRSARDLVESLQRLLREDGRADDAPAAEPPEPLARRRRRSLPRERTESRTPR